MRQRCPGGCPYCYANVKGRSNYKGHRAYRRPRDPLKWEAIEAMKRPNVSGGASGRPFDWESDSVLSLYPNLCEFLFDGVWEDGSARVPGTLLLFVQDGVLKGCCNDKALGRVLFVSGANLTVLLDACDDLVASDVADWRVSSPPAGRGGRGK